jgi:hypothetical protein
MTQTIKKCNEIPAGKTYPVEHLRTAESIEQLCEYVDAGHPIANFEGGEARLLRVEIKSFYYVDAWQGECFISCGLDRHFLLDRIKLAPLAYRNGRPLHVGDDIEILYGTDESGKTILGETLAFAGVENPEEYEWRFADEAEAV